MTKIETTVEKATDHARKVSENGLVFVYHNTQGVYWLAVKTPNQTNDMRSLSPVGTDKTGIRYIKEKIEEYFSEK